MTQQIVPYQVEGVAVAGTSAEWGELNSDQIDLLKRTVADGASNEELDMFLQVCRGLRLNPFVNRQVQWIKRRTWDRDARQWRDTMSIQIGIDGYRLLAERSGKYLGSGEPEFCGLDEVWRKIWLREEFPAACRVGVWRKGAPAPLWGVVLWREFVQLADEYSADGKTKTGRKVPNSMWATKPTHMLAKCAEALALRKAFPAELAGVELSMEDADALPAPRVRAEVSDLYGPLPEELQQPRERTALAAPAAPAVPEADGIPRRAPVTVQRVEPSDAQRAAQASAQREADAAWDRSATEKPDRAVMSKFWARATGKPPSGLGLDKARVHAIFGLTAENGELAKWVAQPGHGWAMALDCLEEFAAEQGQRDEEPAILTADEDGEQPALLDVAPTRQTAATARGNH